MKKIPMYCDSKSSIRICHNPVKHSKMKHIALQYQFIKDHVEDGNVEVHFVRSADQLDDVEVHFVRLANQLDDIFNKALAEVTFNRILHGLGMIEANLVPKSY